MAKGINISGKSVHISGSNSVVIDGRTFNGDVSIVGNKVVVNGVEQDGELLGDITITVEGSCKSVETTSGDVTIQGNTNSVKTMSGDVDVKGNIDGDVKTMSGDVTANTVNGRVSTVSGDIRGVR